MSCCSILEETGVWIKLGPPKLGPGKNMSAYSTIIFSKQCHTHPPAFWRGPGCPFQASGPSLWSMRGGRFQFQCPTGSLGSRVVLDASRRSRKMTSCSLPWGWFHGPQLPKCFFLSKERIPGSKAWYLCSWHQNSWYSHRKWSNGYWLMPIFVCSSPRAHLCNLCTSFFLFLHFFLSLHILAEARSGSELRHRMIRDNLWNCWRNPSTRKLGVKHAIS